MTNDEKATHIRQWIDPEERVTVQFLDVRDLNAQVTDCNNASVTLSIETHVSHMNQHVSFPLSQVEVTCRTTPGIRAVPCNGADCCCSSVRTDRPSFTRGGRRRRSRGAQNVHLRRIVFVVRSRDIDRERRRLEKTPNLESKEVYACLSIR